MTAPELPTMLKEIALALEEKARFPKELWDSTPAEALLSLVAEANVFGELSRQVVEIAIVAWRAKVDEARQKFRAEREAASPSVVEKLASTIGALSSGGPVGGDGNLKAKHSYYHGTVPTNGYQRHILSTIGLANFPGEPSWTDTRWVLTPALWPTHPDSLKKSEISTSLTDTILGRVESYVQSAKSSSTNGLVGWWDVQLRNFKPMVATFVTLMRGLNDSVGDFSTSDHATKVLDIVQSQVETLEGALKTMILKMDQMGKLPPPSKEPGRPAVPFWLLKSVEERKDAIDRKNDRRRQDRVRGRGGRGGRPYYESAYDYRHDHSQQNEGSDVRRGTGGRGGGRGRGGGPIPSRKRPFATPSGQPDGEKEE